MNLAITQEATRLYTALQHTGWSQDDCDVIAPLTEEINRRKKEQNAIILAHSYQTPDIMYGIADVIGDSYSLSKIASQHPAKKIIFCSVYFMGETAKILSPEKDVLVPARAGCSLAESITAKDVRQLKTQYPDRPVICYINTTAEVKAQSDVCCTSSNALKVIHSFPDEEIIFIPDKLMGQNLQKETKKKLILWNGTCVVHERFDEARIRDIRTQFPNAKLLAHTECSPGVVSVVDMAGSTGQMLDFVAHTDTTDFVLITECGITDRIKTEFPNKNIVGTCNLCPYMKSIMMKDVLTALTNPRADQIVTIPDDILKKAKQSLERMMEIGV